jgi:glutamate-ammonia-ligase adenylyltransferase
MPHAILDSIRFLPGASDADAAPRVLAHWRERAANATQDAAWEALLKHPTCERLLAATAGNAPYLARLLIKYPDVFAHFADRGPNQTFADILAEMHALKLQSLPQAAIMKELRVQKGKAALLTAFADISALWDVPTTTRQLSHFAGAAIQIATDWLLHDAARKGEFAPANPATPGAESGIVILGMGKLGAYELNYSSDIDLILLFEHDVVPYRGARSVQHFMTRFAQDLVHLLQERNEHGYVFRTDLRLRPDPMSTPPAVNTTAALLYYETVGQNWERAAMIKARPMACDIEAGERFLKELIPYIWRKYLDFATIADIHSIKRQMNATSGRDIALYGHNIKTGAGGIREVEFFVQTQQLVWGGRIPSLRVRGTLSALEQLMHHGLIGPDARDALGECYLWFRKVEHALQMFADEQTHSLPQTPEGMQALCVFLGYPAVEAFESECLTRLQLVHRYYLDSMEGDGSLTAEGNLVFTGVEADTETLKTLTGMGYNEPRIISDIIQGWHRGSRKSTRSKRSRQVLTELVPQILRRLSETVNPDAAFLHFDDFLSKLPSGAQIFSLFAVRPELLTLVADILGSAPALGATLSRDPTLLDSVLESDFYGVLPTRAEMTDQLRERLRHARDYEQQMALMRIFNNDKRFQAGVHMLKSQITPAQAGAFLTETAEALLEITLEAVAQEIQGVATDRIAILGLGKLGGGEMTFGSDLDIVFVYDDGSDDGELRTRMHRLSQRVITALTLLTREGRLYEVDTRLRPGGTDGPLATSLSGFDAYFEKSAWTFERQALTRARVIASNHADFTAQVEATIARHVCKPCPGTLLNDIRDMRARIAQTHTTRNPWHLKHIRGGLVDLDFMAQYLVLRDVHRYPTMWQREAGAVFAQAQALNLLTPEIAQPLIAAKHFLSDLLSITRLVSDDVLRDETITPGLARTLAQVLRFADFPSVKEAMLKHEAEVQIWFDRLEIL